MNELYKLIAMKAAFETFGELINSCDRADEEKGFTYCIICGKQECDPNCTRARAERALHFLKGPQ
jgi:hypothetical protein